MSADDPGATSRLGATIGGKIARLVADASAASRSRTMPAVGRTVNSVIDSWMKVIDHEAQQAMGPLLRQITEHPDLDPALRPLMRAVTHPTGQWQAWIAQRAAGGLAQTGLIPLLDNLLTPATAPIIALTPNRRLDFGTASKLAMTGLWDMGTAEREAAQQGISAARFAALVSLSRPRFGPSDLAELLNRGIVNPAQVRTEMTEQGWTDGRISAFLATTEARLSPSEAAEMVVRNVIEEDTGRAIAASWGYSGRNFDRIAEITGAPPGTQDLLFAFRRGIIDRDRLIRGIRQGRLRDEWADVIESLRFVPMSTGVAINAAVQGHISEGQAAEITAQNGLDPAHFRASFETAGNPMAFTSALELWRRGQITQSRVEEVIREGAVKTKYLADLLTLRRRLLPYRTISLVYRHGGFTREEALQRIMWFGYPREDAEALMASDDQRSLGAERELAVATVRELLEARAITEDQAKGFYAASGYSDAAAQYLVDLAAIRRERRATNLAVSRIRSRFTAFRIDEREAVTALDRIGLISTERDDLLDAWRIEREVSIPRLTTSQIQQALTAGLISPEDAFTRLRENGYTEMDATILVRLRTPGFAEQEE
jgi:hypothetical protein